MLVKLWFLNIEKYIIGKKMLIFVGLKKKGLKYFIKKSEIISFCVKYWLCIM